MTASDGGRIRIDKWLHHARFWKTRSAAAEAVAGGAVRLNGQRVTKPAQPVGPGDTLTFVQGRQVRVVRVLAPGTRRGPAEEARGLYDDLDAPKGPAGDASGMPRTGPHLRLGSSGYDHRGPAMTLPKLAYLTGE